VIKLKGKNIYCPNQNQKFAQNSKEFDLKYFLIQLQNPFPFPPSKTECFLIMKIA